MKKPKPETSSRPLQKSVADTWQLYRGRLHQILVATFPPLALIVLLRWLSDDYTGDQYGAVRGLITIFNTMLLARLVTVGWQRKEVRLLPFYNGVMSRYLSGAGLLIVLVAHTLPLLAGVLLLGLVLVGQATAAWLLLILPLCAAGLLIALHASFSLFAMMDDMSLTVLQSLRISGRLARRYARPLILRVFGALGVVAVFGGFIVWLGGTVAPALQSEQTQLFVDAILSWILTPFVFCYGATVYKKLLEAHE